MGVAAAGRFFAGEQIPLRLVAERRHHRIEERHIHPPAPPVALAGEQRREDARRSHHPGADVGERGADLGGRPLRRPGEAHPARLPLHDRVVTRQAGERAVLAVSRDGTPDEARMLPEHPLRREPEPPHRPRPEVLDEDIARPDQPGERLPAPLRLEIEDDALLSPVHGEEVSALAAGERRAPAAGVVPGRGFDLDDLGPEVGEHHRRVRTGEHPRQIEDPHPGERRTGRGGVQRQSASVAARARSGREGRRDDWSSTSPPQFFRTGAPAVARPVREPAAKRAGIAAFRSIRIFRAAGVGEPGALPRRREPGGDYGLQSQPASPQTTSWSSEQDPDRKRIPASRSVGHSTRISCRVVWPMVSARHPRILAWKME